MRRPSGWCGPVSALPTGFDAEWLVVYVETPDLLRLSEDERNRRIAILRLATSLGAEAITLGGSSASAELLSYARTRNVSRILVGTPNRPRWRRLLRPSTTEQLLEAGGDIDVIVIGNHGQEGRGALPTNPIASGSGDSDKQRWPRYLLALVATQRSDC